MATNSATVAAGSRSDAARAATWQVVWKLREAAGELLEVAQATAGAGGYLGGTFAVAVEQQAHAVEDVLGAVQSAAEDLVTHERSRPEDADPPPVSALLAAGEPVDEPDVFALALLVEAIDGGELAPLWQRRAAARALAWALLTACSSSRVAELLAGIEDPTVHGCILDAAMGRA